MSNDSTDPKTSIAHVAIVRAETIKLIMRKIQERNFSTILEIGTGYGYSAGMICKNCAIKKLTTIEINPVHCQLAKKFLREFKQVECINMDAHDFLPKQKYDLIFFDGPKSRQETLIMRYLPFLSTNGMIIIDNLYLKRISEIVDKNRQQKALLKKIGALNQ
jgi:predicted O-methyltransferase YrrM